MERTLNLELHKYTNIPHALRVAHDKNVPAKSLSVGLASLFHHYYLDSFGRAPPNPDPAQFEHVQFLLPCRDFRFQGSGLGISPAIRRHRSNELGQAFCRWFLHEHLNITYFAHMEAVLKRQLQRAFKECRIERSASGDAPDYFCAESVNQVYLAEAKGRYSAISFKNKNFAEWRAQFDRVVYRDSAGMARNIKGHIVATRFATEETPRLHSGIWAEDPESPGQRPLGPDDASELGSAILSAHYSNIAAKLWQPVLASALATGVPLPEELRIVGIAWRVRAGPLVNRRFIGGYFGNGDSAPVPRDHNGSVVFERPNPLRLDQPSTTFFGVEEGIFKQVVEYAKTSSRSTARISHFDETEFFNSGFSVLRDGSALGPVDFFFPEESVIF